MDSDLSEILKKGLEKKGWSQKKLADFLHTTPVSISEWLNGKKISKWQIFVKILEELDLVEEIFPNYKKINELSSASLQSVELEWFRKLLVTKFEELSRKIDHLQDNGKFLIQNNESLQNSVITIQSKLIADKLLPELISRLTKALNHGYRLYEICRHILNHTEADYVDVCSIQENSKFERITKCWKQNADWDIQYYYEFFECKFREQAQEFPSEDGKIRIFYEPVDIVIPGLLEHQDRGNAVIKEARNNKKRFEMALVLPIFLSGKIKGIMVILFSARKDIERYRYYLETFIIKLLSFIFREYFFKEDFGSIVKVLNILLRSKNPIQDYHITICKQLGYKHSAIFLFSKNGHFQCVASSGYKETYSQLIHSYQTEIADIVKKGMGILENIKNPESIQSSPILERATFIRENSRIKKISSREISSGGYIEEELPFFKSTDILIFQSLWTPMNWEDTIGFFHVTRMYGEDVIDAAKTEMIFEIADEIASFIKLLSKERQEYFSNFQ